MEQQTAPKAAIRLSKILEQFHASNPAARFPVNVEQLALGCHELFQWNDPIARVEAASIPGFEGGLFADDDRTRWMLVYNDTLSSPGRIRFTQAHELGHYILHRQRQAMFNCSEASEMRNLKNGHQQMESEADEFASYLLMPLDDLRNQLSDTISLEALRHCADRYGVSLTAAALKWLSQTTDKAMLVVSNDGYINWSSSSDAAARAGIFYRTRSMTIPVPERSLAADTTIAQEHDGRMLPATVWFEHADPGLFVREMKITSEQYDNVTTLLVFPSITNAWDPRRFG